jgi:hypothetical protein
MWFAPVGAQVLPCGVLSDDQTDFLNARPSLELLFPRDGGAYRAEAFEVDQLLDVIARRVAAGVRFVLVFCYADFDLGCDSDVKLMEVAGEDVDVCDFVRGLRYRRSGSWRTGNDKCKDEMQGSLHCAAHDSTVRRFGRDDTSFGASGILKNSNSNEAGFIRRS